MLMLMCVVGCRSMRCSLVFMVSWIRPNDAACLLLVLAAFGFFASFGAAGSERPSSTSHYLEVRVKNLYWFRSKTRCMCEHVPFASTCLWPFVTPPSANPWLWFHIDSYVEIFAKFGFSDLWLGLFVRCSPTRPDIGQTDWFLSCCLILWCHIY